MTDWITQEDWSTVELGDTIRVTSNGAMLTGEVVSIGINGHGSVGINSELLRGTAKIMLDEWSLSVPAKPAVELPTLAGVYYGSCFGNGVPYDPDRYDDDNAGTFVHDDGKAYWVRLDRETKVGRFNKKFTNGANNWRIHTLTETKK